MYRFCKRLIALLLILAMVLCFVACGEDEINADSDGKSSKPTGNSAPTNPGTSQPPTSINMGQTAFTIGEYEVSAAIVNYFYIDAILNYCNQYSYYISYILDINAPLNGPSNTDQQGVTWADKFLNMAIDNLTVTYQLYDQAQKNGFKLSEEEEKSIDALVENLEIYAIYYGFANADAYLSDTYGAGATAESYRDYCRVHTIADRYYAEYADSITYTDNAIREFDAENYWQYDSYTFEYYYFKVSDFVESSQPTDDEKAAAIAKAKNYAKALAAGEYADADAFDAAINDLMNCTTGEYKANRQEDILYQQVPALFRDWLSGQSDAGVTPRKQGDTTVIVNESGTDDNKTLNGFYVLRFERVEKNQFNLKNVRHLLVKFEGGTTDAYGNVTYTDAEKAAARNAALALLAQFESSDKSEETFAAMANEHSDDGNGTTGGLYENIFPGQMVQPFEDWCYEEGRQHGDYGLVETQYGYHIMFFVSDAQLTYRDYMIQQDLLTKDLTAYLDRLANTAKTELITTEYLNLSLKVSTFYGS